MTKNDNTSLVLTKKLSATRKAALAQAESVLKAAGFSCWTISAGNSVDDRKGRKSWNVASNIHINLSFGACAAIAILSEALKHLDNPKDQLAYLVGTVKMTLEKVNPELAQEINNQVNSGADDEDDPEKMN